MALVHHKQKIVGEIINQAKWTCSGSASIEIPRIILNAAAIAQFAHHFHVVGNTIFEAFCFQEFALATEKFHLLCHIVLNAVNDVEHSFFLRHVNGRRINNDLVNFLEGMPRNGIDGFNHLHFIAKKIEPVSNISTSDIYIHSIAFDTECSVAKLLFGARIQRLNEKV